MSFRQRTFAMSLYSDNVHLSMKKINIFKIAIAAVVLLLLGWLFRDHHHIETISANQNELQIDRDNLLANPNTLRVNLLRSLDPQVKDTRGEILWNSQMQRGIVQLQGLPAPDKGQRYQLWIYDLKKENSHPSLAANFFAGNNDDRVYRVAIRPKKSIEKAFKFVVTKGDIANSDFDQAEPILFAQP